MASLSKRLTTYTFFCIALLLTGLSTASASLFDKSPFGQNQDGPLPVEEAFVFSSEQGEGGNVFLRWHIPEGYYLYRDRMDIEPSDGIEVANRINSETDSKDDPLFGTVEVFHNQADVELQTRSLTGQAHDGTLNITYQGCWEGGICYPPVNKRVPLVGVPSAIAASAGSDLSQPDSAKTVSPVVTSVAPAPQVSVSLSEQDRFAEILSKGNWALIIGGFFLAGLALSFTPCVFPMIPIISSIIAGHGHKITTGRALFLSAVYVLAVSVTYTIAGVLAGLFGENLQAAFQNPWIIGFFSLIFVALSFSMFGFYDLQIPSKWQSRLNDASNHQKGGTVTGVAIMGLLSALIVGPCMAAPLAGALIYIGQTGDPLLGGVALFTLSLGMGVPILLVGTSAGKLLPKAGLWMDAIKSAFGVALLLMAIWMLDRVVSTQITMFLTAAVLIVTAIYMKALDHLPDSANGWNKLWKGVGLLILLYGGALFVGLMSGSQSLIYPLKGLTGGNATAAETKKVDFITVTSLEELQPILDQAKQNNQSVMLDFYADWCVSCIELEHYTFSDDAVQRVLDTFVNVKVDVTSNDDDAKAISKAYKVIGPPALIFYDRKGELRPELTVVGVIDPKEFVTHLTRLDGV